MRRGRAIGLGLGLALGFAALIAGAAWIGAARGPDLAFSDIDDLPGFRTLAGAAGASRAGGGTVLVGVDGGAATAPSAPDASSDAPICALLWESGAPAEGPADGRPRIAVFSDANCPYCRTLDGILAELAAARPDLRVTHHEWPVLGPGSVVAARAALAAERQGRFRALKTRLLDAAFAINPAYLAAVAPPLGIDVGRLSADMAAPEVDRILAATDAAARRFGFAGTPSLVIGGTVAEGALSRARIEAILDAEAARDDRPCG